MCGPTDLRSSLRSAGQFCRLREVKYARLRSALKCLTTWASFTGEHLIVMPREDNLVGGRAAAAEKFKNKKLSAASRKVYERAAAAAERKAVAAEAVAAEAKEGALGAGAIEAALADALGARGAATKARARLGGAGTEEAKAAEARRASARHARQAQLAGSVAEVNASPADKVAFAEAELMLTVGQVALRKMRAQGHGWVCALWVQKQLRVFLARDLDGGDGGRKEGWIEEVVAGGRKERAPVRVAEGRLESQRLVVKDEQEFFFFDIDRVDLFSDLGGDKKAEPVVDELEPPPPVVDELEPPPVHCRPSSVVFLPYSVAAWARRPPTRRCRTRQAVRASPRRSRRPGKPCSGRPRRSRRTRMRRRSAATTTVRGSCWDSMLLRKWWR